MGSSESLALPDKIPRTLLEGEKRLAFTLTIIIAPHRNDDHASVLDGAAGVTPNANLRAEVSLEVLAPRVNPDTLVASPAFSNGFTLVSGFGSTELAANDGAAGGDDETTFVVRMDAGVIGSQESTISFGNGDSDENTFDFSVQGQVNGIPQIIDNHDPGFAMPDGSWVHISFGAYPGKVRQGFKLLPGG